MIAQDKAFFLKSIDLLRTWKKDQEPQWGSMSPQHMVEHLVGSWRISNGRAQAPQMLTNEDVEVRREFLFSEKAYAKNIANPTSKTQGNAPLRKESLNAAIDQLQDEMKAFFEYHKSHVDAIEMHPVFGPLNFEGWMTFQTKHMTHHMMQFGLLRQFLIYEA